MDNISIKKKFDASSEPSELTRIFPLQFLCKYLTKKQDELLSRELETAYKVHSIRNIVIDSLPLYEDLVYSDSSKGSKQIEKICKMQYELVNMLEELETQLTLKGTAFEDMSNMLMQTEPLITQILYRDALTNSYNRYFIAKNNELFDNLIKKGVSFSVAYIDIDNFKDFNTKYGHEFGDTILKSLNELVTECISEYDSTYFVRVGGDEFILLNTGLEYSFYIQLLEKIKKNVCTHDYILSNQSITISLSMGAANYKNDKAYSLSELASIADKRLYSAKNNGKNRIVF